LWHLAKEYRIDAINFHFPSLNALNWIALQKLRLFPGKVILSFHGSDIRTAHGLHGWERFAYRYLLREADAVVSCSKDLQSEVVALEPRVKACVIYNGIDEGRFGRVAGPTVLPAQLENKELILSIGKYEFRKAHDLLLRAFARVLEERPAAHLVIVGSTGPEIEKTKAAVLESGQTEHVTLYNDLPHRAIPGMFAIAHLFVLSSRWVPGKIGEGFPVAILEAAVAGKPVVTTRTCGAGEIIEDGVTGRLVALEDAGALAQAMCELLEDKERARDMAENLRRKVLDEFTWARAYRSYAGLCRIA
jgi:glycosyltransferase involved in cell wall biosynthesis